VSRWLVSLVIVSAGVAWASVDAGGGTISIGNSLRYSLSQETNEEILEDYFDVDYTHGPFLARLRYEVFQPSEERRDREGQVFRAVGGETQWGTLWVGNFYGLFGKGMAFHGYEDRDLRVDTSLDGLSLDLEHGPASLKAFSGRTAAHTTVFHGADAEVRPLAGLALGGSYLSRRQTSSTGYVAPDLELGTGRIDVNVNPVGCFGLDVGPTYLSAEAGQRSRSGAAERGEGWFAAVGTSLLGAAVGFEYKDYLHMGVVAEGKEYTTPPPAAMEHAWTLLARHSHELNPDDEKGFLGRLEWQATDIFGLTASYSVAQDQRDTEVFSEAMAEARIAEVSRTPVTVACARTEEFLGVAPTADRNVDDRRTHLTFIGDVTFPLHGPWTGRFSGEHQHTDGDAVGEFDLEHLELEVSRSPGISVALVGEFSNVSRIQQDLPWLSVFEEQTSWFSAQCVLDIAPGHQLRVVAGSRPEGKVCAGGACRTVPAFKGIEAQLSSLF
jgi:hypothetical protein